MSKVRRSSYNLAFKLKIVAEAEAVENNSKIAREYGISESMVHRWRKDQANLFNGELKMSAKRKTMGCYTPKYPELDQTLLEWFSEQRSQGKFFVLTPNQLISVRSFNRLFDRVAIVYQSCAKDCLWLVSFRCHQNKPKQWWFVFHCRNRS